MILTLIVWGVVVMSALTVAGLIMGGWKEW